jgi:hypothetical protein
MYYSVDKNILILKNILALYNASLRKGSDATNDPPRSLTCSERLSLA